MGSTFPQGLLQGLMGGMSGTPSGAGGGAPMAPVSGGMQPMGGQRPPMAGGKGGPHPAAMGQPGGQPPTPTPPSRPPGIGNPLAAPQPPPRPPGIGMPASPPMPPVRPTTLGQNAAGKPTSSPPMPPPRPTTPGPVSSTTPTLDPRAKGKEASLTSDVPASAPDTGTTRSAKNPYDLIKAAGGTDEEAKTLAAIAQPESGGNPRSHNTNVGTGDNSYGLWQINMLGKMGPERRAKFGLKSNEDLYDPATNAKVALAMHRESGGYKDWSTYTSGKYKKYLGEGKRNLMARSGSGSTPTGGGAFKMPDRKDASDLTAAKGADSSIGQTATQQGKSQKDKKGEGAGGEEGALKQLKSKVEVPEGVKPVENILTQRYASFQEAVASKKASFKDLLDHA